MGCDGSALQIIPDTRAAAAVALWLEAPSIWWEALSVERGTGAE